MDADTLTAQTAKASQPRFTRVRAVVNAASGSVGPNPSQRMQAIADKHGVTLEIAEVQPQGLAEALTAAIAAQPDLLIVLAGDGTVALAAGLCGPDGPIIAPLPGGTMNMLPHAIYGRRAWPEALDAALESGVELTVSGGEVAGRGFYVAAILGEPALFATAREAVRKGRWWIAWLRLQRAIKRAFGGRLRFCLNGGGRMKTTALSLMCPLVSRALEDNAGLEAAALDPRDALDAFRLGVATMLGRWRDDPAVTMGKCVSARVWAKGHIPVILDGEPRRLKSPVEIVFKPRAFRALAPADCAAIALFRPSPTPLEGPSAA